ncbi:MAG TPA: UDP-N-acetylenolpyruvoylglucosamine reductase, partial [Erysipelotrichaceae bacterium]|nr:UDP-N-acetylenolpyruvoylglucosamine reductase [Erysipelotrichaceae bacterium]
MSIDKIAIELSNYATVEENVPMSSLTSLRIGGNARYVVYPTTVVSLVEVMNLIKKYNLSFKV